MMLENLCLSSLSLSVCMLVSVFFSLSVCMLVCEYPPACENLRMHIYMCTCERVLCVCVSECVCVCVCMRAQASAGGWHAVNPDELVHGIQHHRGGKFPRSIHI